MADPIKIKFDYENPENVEAEVPGSQKLREATPNDSAQNGGSSEGNSNDITQIPESVSLTEKDSSRNHHEITEKRNGVHGETTQIIDKQSDKRSKTKIPVSRFKQTVEKVKEERRESKEKKEHESHIPVRRPSIPKPTRDHKTAPTTVKKEITITKTEIRGDSSKPITQTIVKKQVIEAEDEFDKIFADIIDSSADGVDDNLLNTKVDDPEKLETKFEEIIHDYDEHKVESIGVEVRRSRIPYLKRRSQQDIELSAQADRTSKIIAARDKLRLRHSLTQTEDFESALDAELKKAQTSETNTSDVHDKVIPKNDTVTEKETTHEVITSPNSKTEITRQLVKTVSTSSTDKNENASIIETTVQEVSTNESTDKKENKKQFVTEENIVKGSIKIGIPVFNSHVHEFTKTNESAKTVEVKSVLTYESESQDISVSNNVNNIKNEFGYIKIEPSGNHLKHHITDKTDVKTTTKYLEKSEKSNSSVINEVKTNYQSQQRANESIEEVHTKNKQGSIISNVISKEVVETEINSIESSKELKTETKYTEDTEKSNISLDDNKVKTNQSPLKDNQIGEENHFRWKVGRAASYTDSVKESVKTVVNKQHSINELKTETSYRETSEKSSISEDAIEVKTKDQTAHKLDEINVEKEVNLRKKLGRNVINTDSKESIEIETHKRESINELNKKKSVLSKIALFEQKEDQVIPKSLKKDTKLPKINTSSSQTKEHNHVHTPLIVDEVFKPFQADIEINKDINKEENLKDTNNKISAVKTERIIINSPDFVHYAVENTVQSDKTLVQDNKIQKVIASEKLDSEHTMQKVEYATIKNVESNNSTVTNDLPSQNVDSNIKYEIKDPIHKMKDEDIKDIMNKDPKAPRLSTTKELQAPVIIPGFKPVSELLRSFEAKKEANKTFPKRTISKEYSTFKEMSSPVKHTSTAIEALIKAPEVIQTHENTSITSISYKKNDGNKKIVTQSSYTNESDYFVTNSSFTKDNKVFTNRETDNFATKNTYIGEDFVTKSAYTNERKDLVTKSSCTNDNDSESFATKSLYTNDNDSESFATKSLYTNANESKELSTQKSYISNGVNFLTKRSYTNDYDSGEFVSKTYTNDNENYDDFDSSNDFKSLDDVFSKETDYSKFKSRQEEDMRRAKSLAELDLGDAVKGKVNKMISRMKSVDRVLDRKEVINKKEMPRKRSVSEKIALFEGKLTPSRSESPLPLRIFKSDKTGSNTTHNLETTDKTKTERDRVIVTIEPERDSAIVDEKTERVRAIVTEKEADSNIVSNGSDASVTEKTRDESEEVNKKIEELSSAKLKYGTVGKMAAIELSNKVLMPVISVGTAMLDPHLLHHIITAAIDLGYRGIDSAYIYGNENAVGEAIKAKIDDGTVKREDLFITSKLWSTFHRSDLVEAACRASLEAMGLEYFDLYLIHNPMSFKEGGSPVPKIATVLQYSEHDYLDAWYGMEKLVAKGLVRSIGVSNFNSVQLQRILDKGRIKPVVNQVECHPYLSQQRLDLFCSERNVTLMCFGVLGSKGTPKEYKGAVPAVIDDALVQVVASGLGISPAQLLISYQLENGHGVVVKSSSAAHLWDNLQALGVHLTMGQVDALHALNRNKRMFTFKGMGDTHKNYPFNNAF